MTARSALIGVATLGLAGCAQPAGELLVPPQPPVVWPKAPDSPRIRYVGELKGSDDLRAGKTGAQALGEVIHGPTQPARLVTPHAVAVHLDGQRVAVADTNAACVHVFDLKQRAYSRRDTCDNSARLECPVGVAWVGDVLWVADAKLHALAVLEPGRERLVGQEALRRPAGLAYCPANDLCYVSDAEAHAILAFDREGRQSFESGSKGSGPGEFNYPSHLACGPGDGLTVADSLNFRIQQLSLDGSPLGSFGQKGDATGDFALPKGVAIAADGSIWVVDAHFENVQGFTKDGKLLLSFGREGQGPGEFWLPAGLCIDAQGRMWVADAYNRRVQVFQLLP